MHSFFEIERHERNFCPYLNDCIDSAILDCKFSDESKKTDILSIFRGHDPMSKCNFRPKSVHHLPLKSMQGF